MKHSSNITTSLGDLEGSQVEYWSQSKILVDLVPSVVSSIS